MIVSKLKQYLANLEVNESLKPECKRRKVPSLSDIHRNTGINYASISKLANNKAKRLDFGTAHKIIEYVRSLGHEMGIADIVEFEVAKKRSLIAKRN